MSTVEYVLGLVFAVLLAAIGELVSDEIRARLDRIPLALLTMAARRLPRDQQKALYVEAWLPELHYVLQGDEAAPITRNPFRGEFVALSSEDRARAGSKPCTRAQHRYHMGQPVP